MCTSCGCSGAPESSRHDHEAHEHAQDERHAHAHAHHRHAHAPPAPGTILRLEEEVLSRNRRVAEQSRAWLAERGILALNLVSSPGAGKTTLIERTLRDLAGELDISVIVGDQETELDAERLRGLCPRVLQVNTGRGCHLDAAMVARSLEELEPPRRSVVFIENVGNLVCPALFDLGERLKVVLASVTEGEDKPLKYPHIFRAGEVLVVSKVDLLPFLRFDVAAFLERAKRVNARLQPLLVSAARGDGMDGWYGWLRNRTAG
jgi:hydrogenase nickel incorporation protein HypB